MCSAISSPYARPFLKWAGGKGQLLEQIEARLPQALLRGAIHRYAEPFVGSGAVFFKLLQRYSMQECLLADLNLELILAYKTVQKDVERLIEALGEMQAPYLALDEGGRRAFYYQVREEFNGWRNQVDYENYGHAWVTRTAQLLFLNRTCFNGLFRVNASGEFNVPFGRYKNPRLLDAENLCAVSSLLQGVCIQSGDFTAIEPFVTQDTFVYFDPPYRPLSKTAHFTAYSNLVFDDGQQLRLAAFFRALDRKGCKLMLSNADPRNIDPNDDFFEKAYAGFRIERIKANRNINSNPQKRGSISELIILNY